MRPNNHFEVQQSGSRFVRRLVWAIMLSLLIIIAVFTANYRVGHASPVSGTIRSGLTGACLDVFHSQTASGTAVDAWGCNGTSAQDWTTTDTTIRHDDTRCVTVDSGSLVVMKPCNASAAQVWLREQQSYYNPDTDRCLSASNGSGKQLMAIACQLSAPSQRWTVGAASKAPACSGAEGAMVACQAIKQWGAWQATGSNHATLLTAYTDGTPYEAWCADFVSYIYKQAGYPFTNGSADGWDENDANQVQYMGLTMHIAGNGYQPKAGDIAFFNYPGGHVEIVVSGGAAPTFVYGDSATVDPTTGNGQMKANTITSDGQMGQVMYYLSPN